jgi:hypothetical protein
MKIKLNVNMGTLRKGLIVNVLCDKSGTPLDIFWRRRLKDAKIDNCCEIVKPKPRKLKDDK